MTKLTEYKWIAVLGIIFGFGMAFGIGANDVANAFASSVSARSLSLGQAVVVASIFEFSGAVLLGSSVTGTIRGKILKSSYYKSQPAIIMFGNLCSLLVAAIWLMVATALEYPISTTHTIVAALIGFSLAAEGFKSIYWNTAGKIFISWFASPSLSGVISFIFYTCVRRFVLQNHNNAGHIADNTFERATKVFPMVVFIGIVINVSFVLLKTTKIQSKWHIDNYNQVVVLPASLGGAFLCALITYVCIIPRLKTRIDQHFDDIETRAADEEREKEKADAENQDDSDEGVPKDTSNLDEAVVVSKDEPAGVQRSTLGHAWNWVAENTYKQDLKTASLHESKRAAEIWEAQEPTDPKTERLFSYLQVFTACMTSFAHGANDVANAIAPVSAILDIYNTGEFNSKAPVKKWILAMGGFGIVCGCATYGYKIMKAVGFKLTAITPSRGFCIELATALSVSIASYMSIPVSSTQCLVGATVGAGVASGGFKNVQWLYLLRVSSGWVTTFFVTLICTAGFFAYCAYSPSLSY